MSITLFLMLLSIQARMGFAQLGEFNVVIDQKLKPDPATIPGGHQKVRQVGIIQDPKGRNDQFVENEIIFKPGGSKELDAFLNRFGALVVRDHKIPDIPDKYKDRARKIPSTSGFYLIQINPDKVDLKNLTANGQNLGLKGTYVCSSANMRALFALCLEEWSQRNSHLDLNGVFKPMDCYSTSSQEYPVDASAPNPALPNDGFMDPFQLTLFDDPDLHVTSAWRTIDLFGYFRFGVPICIIDGGFDLNDDFPLIIGYDFVDEDYDPSGSEEGYHGTGSLSISCAAMDNQFGSVGTGAPVTFPYAFRHDWSFDGGAWAIRTATGWGAKIISMSFSGECNWWCDVFGGISGESAMNDAVNEAIDNNLILLASAGNDEIDLGGHYLIPTDAGTGGRRPIIVGAIDLNTKRAVQQADGYSWGSNYGRCDIWAPGGPDNDIWVTPRPPDTIVSHFNGTSCACPYTAGIVALLCAIYPDVTIERVREILLETAQESPDTRVQPGYITASGVLWQAIMLDDIIDPQNDDQEPNSIESPFLIEHDGEYCNNLHLRDIEDGFYFILDDYTHVQVEQQSNMGMGNIELRSNIVDPEDDWPLPFDGNLAPATYYIHFTLTGVLPYFYNLNFTTVGAVAISPDVYEINNTLDTAADLRYPGNAEGATWTVEDVNFHVSGDVDYFDLKIPDLPEGPSIYDEGVQITVEATGDGYATSAMDLDVYGADGEILPLRISRSVELEDIRDTFPDGHIRFEVSDDWSRRNYYHIIIGYDRWIRGVEVPSTITFIDIPEWMEAESDRHLLDMPPSLLEGLPVHLPFPSDPAILKIIASGKTPTILPDEMLLLKWPETGDLVMDFYFSGSAQELGFGLVDGKGEVIVEAKEIVPILAQAGGTCKQIKFKDLKQGFHGIKVSGIKYPMFYDTKIESVNVHVEKMTGRPAPVQFNLYQNYPNPFNPATVIGFDLPDLTHARLEIYNLLGESVEVLADNQFSPGAYYITWNGLDHNGCPVSNGVYFYRLTLPDRQYLKKMTVLR